MTGMDTIKEIIANLDSEELCRYCNHREYCDGCVKCYGGEPIYPPCADGLDEDDIDIDLYLEDMEESDEA